MPRVNLAFIFRLAAIVLNALFLLAGLYIVFKNRFYSADDYILFFTLLIVPAVTLLSFYLSYRERKKGITALRDKLERLELEKRIAEISISS